MERITKLFIEAQTDFRKSKASEISIEKLYDIVYLLKNKDRTFEESYILAQVYNLLGERIYALKIIESYLKNSSKKESQKLNTLLNQIKKQDPWNTRHFRDLRESRLIKEPTILSDKSFIINRDIDNSFYIKVSDETENIVVLNKNVSAKDCNIFSKKEPNSNIIQIVIEHIKWLGQMKDELIHFYNNTKIEYKIGDIGQNWFDGLRVDDFSIYIDNNSSIETEIIAYDYLQNDFGFRIEIQDKSIIEIEYDPIL